MSGAKGHQTRPITNSSHYLFVKPPKMPKDMNYSFHLANIPHQGMRNAQRTRQLRSALRVTALHRQGNRWSDAENESETDEGLLTHAVSKDRDLNLSSTHPKTPQTAADTLIPPGLSLPTRTKAYADRRM